MALLTSSLPTPGKSQRDQQIQNSAQATWVEQSLQGTSRALAAEVFLLDKGEQVAYIGNPKGEVPVQAPAGWRFKTQEPVASRAGLNPHRRSKA